MLCDEDVLHEVVMLAVDQRLVTLEQVVRMEPRVLLSEVSRQAQWPLRLAERCCAAASLTSAICCIQLAIAKKVGLTK